MANYFNLSVPVRFKAISGKITKNPEESFSFFFWDSRTCQTLCINESFIIPHNGNAAAEKKILASAVVSFSQECILAMGDETV